MAELTVVLSGPDRTRPAVLAALKRAGVCVPDQPVIDPGHGLPPDGLAWITCTSESLNEIEGALCGDWALRQHYHTPPPPPRSALAVALEDLTARIEQLEAR